MIVAISGTPGTGKTEASKILVELLNEELGKEEWRLIDLNRLAEQKRLYQGYDDKRQCNVVDIDKLSQEIGRIGDQDIILESHYAHEMPCDLIIVLRANPKVLRQRMREKGWKTAKIEENVMAEIMEVCRSEALETGKKVFTIDTTKMKPEDVAKEIMDIISTAPPRFEEGLTLPAAMRPELKRPFGELVEGKNEKDTMKKALKLAGKGRLVTVGDPVTYYLLELGKTPDMAVIDGREKRKPFGKEIKLDVPGMKVRNPAGGITRELWEAVERFSAYKKPVKIFVEGEEDLAVLPCMILMPQDSVIFYGMPDKGVVVVKLTREKRLEGIRLIKRIMELQ